MIASVIIAVLHSIQVIPQNNVFILVLLLLATELFEDYNSSRVGVVCRLQFETWDYFQML